VRVGELCADERDDRVTGQACRVRAPRVRGVRARVACANVTRVGFQLTLIRASMCPQSATHGGRSSARATAVANAAANAASRGANAVSRARCARGGARRGGGAVVRGMASSSSSSSSSGKMSSLTAMCEEFRDKFEVEYVTASEVLKRVRDGGDGVKGRALALVDVRGEEERETSRLPNAMSVEEYEAKRDSMGAHDCVCYCTIGYRSGAFAEKLAKSTSTRDDDVDVKYYNLYGSILAWTHAGGELVDANGAPTKRVHTFGKQWDCAAEGYESVYFKHPMAKGFGQMLRGWFGRKK
jgi:rhodanese-related sulfurtransferase